MVYRTEKVGYPFENGLQTEKRDELEKREEGTTPNRESEKNGWLEGVLVVASSMCLIENKDI